MTKVFGAANCTGCVTVKRMLAQCDIEYTEYDVNSLEGMEEAMKYNVRSIPTLELDGAISVGESKCVAAIKEYMGV